jgi:hypothetical protein
MLDLIDLLREAHYDYTIRIKCGSLITRIRNDFISDFLNSDCSHLLFIDSDLYDFKQTFLDLLCADTPKVCGGIYRKKQLKEAYNVNLCKSIEQTLEERKGAFIEVKHIPTGLMIIEKSVFYQMIISYPERKYLDGQTIKYNFFDAGVIEGRYLSEDYYFCDEGRYLSEDYYFCELYRSIGGKVYAVLDSEVTHHGVLNYKGNFKNYLSKLIKKNEIN